MYCRSAFPQYEVFSKYVCLVDRMYIPFALVSTQGYWTKTVGGGLMILTGGNHIASTADKYWGIFDA